MKCERFDYSLILLLQHFFFFTTLGKLGNGFPTLPRVAAAHSPARTRWQDLSWSSRPDCSRAHTRHVLPRRSRQVSFFFLSEKEKKKKARGPHGPLRSQRRQPHRAVFLFLYFLFPFFTKIYFRFENLQKYTPSAPLPAAGTWPPGCRAAGTWTQKKEEEKLQTGPWGRSPGSGAAVPPWPPGSWAAGPQPYIRCWQPLTPIWLTKNPEKKKRERGRERRGEGEAKRRSPVGFSSRWL